MQAVEQIEKKEHELIEYIKDKIIKNIDLLVNWEYSNNLIIVEIEEERMKADKVYMQEIFPILKLNFPLAVELMIYSPMGHVFNDSYYYLQKPRRELIRNNERDLLCILYYKYYYKELESFGYPQKFAKRVIEESEKKGIFIKKRLLGGMGLILPNLEFYIDKSKRFDKFVEYGREGLNIEDRFDWIFEKFNENEKDKAFQYSKKVINDLLTT